MLLKEVMLRKEEEVEGEVEEEEVGLIQRIRLDH